MTAEDALQKLIPLCKLWGTEVDSPESIVLAVASRLAYHEKYEAELFAFQVPLLAERDRLKKELQELKDRYAGKSSVKRSMAGETGP